MKMSSIHLYSSSSRVETLFVRRQSGNDSSFSVFHIADETTNATKERIIMSDTLGGQIRRTHLYITSSGERKVEKCDSYKRNMRGEMIYTTATALRTHSM